MLTLLSHLAGACAAQAFDIQDPPGAEIVQSSPARDGSHEIATGPWRDGRVPTLQAAGLVRHVTWQLPASERTTVDGLAADFEAQLRRNGFDIALSCRDRACGGFDFRHRLDMGQSPEMHVDIGNFRYLSATADGGGRAASVTVSRGGETLYVHAVTVGGTAGQTAAASPSSRLPDTPDGTGRASPPGRSPDLIAELLEHGGAPLDDLGFRTGSSDLSGGDYTSLVALAEFLADDPGRRVVLVGHTDSRGGRESNIALSEARADAVRRHLVDRLGVDPAQVEAAGIGYLAPRASNATEAGREANRRVEVVLLDRG
jgi:OOP family OmpA-OmpF porin